MKVINWQWMGKWFLLLGALGMIFPFLLEAKEVKVNEARGIARLFSGEEKIARDDAKREALKNAIEQGVGTVITSESVMDNFEIVSDRVASASKGAIKSYKILAEGPIDNGHNYEVVITAIVDDEVIQDTAQALRTLHEMTGRKTVMVIYNPSVQGELPLDPKKNANDYQLIKSAITALNQTFLEKRFDVVDPDVLKDVIKDTETITLSNETDFDQAVSRLATKYGAQYYISFTLLASHKPISHDISEAKAIIRAKLYNIGTARMVAQVEGKGNKKYRKAQTGFDVFEGMTDAIGLAAKQVREGMVNSLLNMLFEYIQAGAPVMVRFYGGKNRYNSAFFRMARKIPDVTSVKTISRNRRELFIHVYYTKTTDDFLLDLEDSFYENKRFKGFEMEPGQAGDVLTISLVKE